MPNKVYQVDETALVWQDTGDPGGGSPSLRVFSLNNLATVSGQQGDLHDFGTAARAQRFAWRAWCQFETMPVLGEIVRIYVKTSDGSHPDNDDGTGDAAVSAEDKLNNLSHIGSIIVDEAAADIEMVASGFILLPHRWFGPVFWNATLDNLKATDDTAGFQLTPVPPELQ